jgi:UDP-GlcNAc:undecaprenyl-phosphate GlcNAc-1-phosphate transferase
MDYIGPILALGITSILILWLHPIAKAIGLVDVPDSRKFHDGAIPLTGGPSIFLAVFAVHVLSGYFLPNKFYPLDYYGFYLAGALLVLTGMLDDYRNVSPRIRLVVESTAALIMVYVAAVVLLDFGELFIDGQTLGLGGLAIPITVIATVAMVNALNMSDGLDGLAGTLALVALVGFTFATKMFGNGMDFRILIVLAAAVCGFLVFNARWFGRRKAIVFLGDSGSMFLGFALCWFAIRFTQGESRVMPPAAALWFVMLPLFDAATVTARRLLKRRPPFGADREHLHHIFLLAGFTPGETTAILGGIAVVGVAIGAGMTYLSVPDHIIMGSFLILGLVYLFMIIRSWQVMRFLHRSICRRHSESDRRGYVDRRQQSNVIYLGPERRSGVDRRRDPRRSADAGEHLPDDERKSA